jgi:hypothetical protein
MNPDDRDAADSGGESQGLARKSGLEERHIEAGANEPQCRCGAGGAAANDHNTGLTLQSWFVVQAY